MTVAEVPHPFLKYVGGKAALADTIVSLMPKTVNVYWEPFVGGGAVYFALKRRQHLVHRCVISDSNEDLMNTYRVVRDQPKKLMEWLDIAQIEVENSEYYYSIRDAFSKDATELDYAARFIYLNKTCYNGLYRTNKAGEFNVPFGSGRNRKLYDDANIVACSAALEHCIAIGTADFRNAVEDAMPGDVVYFDPPYVPVNRSGFVNYTRNGFSQRDQEDLAALFTRLRNRGVFVVASNADHTRVRTRYAEHEIIEVTARRSVNSKGSARGPVKELLIVGRP